MPGKSNNNYYQEHREEILVKAREKYKDPKVKEKRRKYVAKNRDKFNEYHREYQRKYRKEHEEEYKAYQKAYQAEYRKIGKENNE